jgi:methyl-accepting chemotaxis protein
LAPGFAAIIATTAFAMGFPSVGLVLAVVGLAFLAVDGWYLSTRPVISVVEVDHSPHPPTVESAPVEAVGVAPPRVSPEQSRAGLETTQVALDRASAAVTDGSGALVSLATHVEDLETRVRAAVSDISASRGMTFQILGQVEVLGESSDQISAMVESIRTIANQTNLLALNATIEAARAGEFGRGFAVVAAEVRILAQNARSATQSIDAIVTEIKEMTAATIEIAESASNQVEATATSMEATGETFDQMRASGASAAEALRTASVHLEPVTETLARLTTDHSLLESTS